jgi:diaminopropionate ammonia-lyase
VAADEGARDGVLEVADVGTRPEGPPVWVVDGYATLFAEAAEQAAVDLVLVPVGVGSLAAAAARAGAAAGVPVVGVEPAAAACLTASLAAGAPTTVPDPGHDDGGDGLRRGLDRGLADAARRDRGTVTVSDAEAQAAMAELDAHGLAIGECGAAPLAALRALAGDPAAADLRAAVGLGPATRVLLVATEGRTAA